MRSTWALGVMLFCAMAACATEATAPVGDDDPGQGPDGGDDVEPNPEPDLDFGTWIVENVSGTPASMGFHGAQAIGSGGDGWVVWAESDEEQILDMDIRAARKDGLSWPSIELTDVPGVQNTFPSMAAVGDSFLLVYNGRRPDTDNDVYLTTATGDSWQEPRDLTSPFEVEDDLRRDFYPVVMASASRQSVAYLSTPIDTERSAIGPSDVRVIDLAGTSPPQTAVIGDPQRPCGMFDAVMDSAGVRHIVASCGGPGATQLVYATDASGAWEQELLFDGALAMLPSLAADAAGDLHLVWRSDVSCPTGSCGEIFYSRRSPAGFSDPVVVGTTPDMFDISAAVGVDEFGRVVIAFSSKVTADDSDIFIAWSKDGTEFSGVRNITNTPDSSEQSPRLTFDPTDKTPSITFETVFRGSEPLNVDIYRAKLTP